MKRFLSSVLQLCSHAFHHRPSRYFVRKMSSAKIVDPSELQTQIETELSKHSVISDDGNQKFTVAVEGNIGCGKTTLLNFFSRFQDVETLEEPVNRWRNVRGQNLLALMYQDPTRWSLTLQTYIQLTMVQMHTKPQVAPVRLIERSIYSAKYCFVENLYASGKMPQAEYTVLTEWFEWLTSHLNTKVDLYVYLRTDPKLLHHRINMRKRPEEQSIPLDYLESLHKLHDDWLLHKVKYSPYPAEVLVLDANGNLDNMLKIYNSKRNAILCKEQ